MLDTLIENTLLKVSEKYGKNKGKRRLKGPKVRVHRNGSVEVSVKDLLSSEAGRKSFEEAHNSELTQDWLKKHGYDAHPIKLTQDC